MALVLALLIGAVAGLRTSVAPAALSWSAWLGLVPLGGTWAAFMASPWALIVLTLLVLAELVVDQLPATPSRKVPQQFVARLISGAFSGAVIGAATGTLWPAAVPGALGAILGTYGGAAARARLAASFGRDRPAALIEDAVAILAGLAVAAAA